MQKLVLTSFPVEDLQTVIIDCVTACLRNRKDTDCATEKNPEDLLTPEDAAKFLKVTSTSLWRMRKSGKIKLYGLGGKRYYKKSELLNALEVLH